MNQDMAMQLIRYALLTFGPIVIAKGWASETQWATVVGAIMVVATWAWGIYVKKGTTSVPDNVAERADVPTVSPITGAVKTGPGT